MRSLFNSTFVLFIALNVFFFGASSALAHPASGSVPAGHVDCPGNTWVAAGGTCPRGGGATSAGATAVGTAASAKIDPLTGLKSTAVGAGLLASVNTTAPTISVFAGRILGGILALVGILFFALMIYGGIRWMLSRGNTQEVEGAKETVVSAIIGLIVVSLGYVLTQFIFSVIQGAASSA